MATGGVEGRPEVEMPVDFKPADPTQSTPSSSTSEVAQAAIQPHDGASSTHSFGASKMSTVPQEASIKDSDESDIGHVGERVGESVRTSTSKPTVEEKLRQLEKGLQGPSSEISKPREKEMEKVDPLKHVNDKLSKVVSNDWLSKIMPPKS